MIEQEEFDREVDTGDYLRQAGSHDEDDITAAVLSLIADVEQLAASQSEFC